MTVVSVTTRPTHVCVSPEKCWEEALSDMDYIFERIAKAPASAVIKGSALSPNGMENLFPGSAQRALALSIPYLLNAIEGTLLDGGGVST